MGRLPESLVNQMYAAYSSGLSLEQVGVLFGRGGRTVGAAFKTHSLPARPRGGRMGVYLSGPGSRGWKGGRTKKKSGYIRVMCPDHPRSCPVGYVYEHTLVAEKMLGRSLLSGEVVHHKNHVKDDNRPENLEVLTSSEHAKQHWREYREARNGR